MKNFIALCLLISTTALGAVSPVIFDNGFGKLLPPKGLKLFDTKTYESLSSNPTSGGGHAATTSSVGVRINGTLGEMWFKNGAADTAWVNVLNSSNGWGVSGNSGLTAGTNFVGTTDAVDLVFKTNATENMRLKESNGFLGVNETSPQAPVHASTSGGADGVLTLQNTSSASHGRYDFGIDSSGFFHLAQNGAGFWAFTVGASGENIGIGQYGGIAGAVFGVYASDLDSIPMIAKGNSGATADLQQWRLSDDTIEARVDHAGNISATNLSGTNTGDVTLAAFGSAPSANGASLSSQALTLQPADATHPGGVSIAAQVIAGKKTFNGGIDGNSTEATHFADPTVSTSLATKNYVDTQLLQLNPAAAVYAASTANIPGTYTNAVGGVCVGDTFTVTATGALSLDGTSPGLNARVLLKNQTSSFQDGVWTVTVVGSIGVSPVLTRALDFDSSADINSGQIIPIVNGTVNAGASWYQTATVSTCSSDSQTWAQFTKPASAYVSSTLTSAHLYVGNVSNVATDVAASGDVSLANTGAFTVAKVNAVTYPASPATGTVPNVTGANTVAYTATPTLGVATSVKGTLSFAGNTSGTVTVQPAAAAGTWSLTLPTTGGTANYFMQTNGSGVSTWAQAVTPDGNVPFAGNESIGGANAFTRSVPNAGTTGTTNNKLAKLTGAPSTAVITATTDTGGAIGVVTAFGGTTSSAEIAMSGTVACTFDGATTAGDYVQISSTTTGNCHDASSTYPTSGQVVGRVLSTNGSGGDYNILIFPAEIQTSGGGGSNGVTSSSNSERIERAKVSTTCTSSPCTLTSSTSGFSSITRTGTGLYTLNFVGGTFSAAPTCTITADNFGGFALMDSPQTSTSMPFVTRNFSLTNTDASFQIICEGPH